MNNQLNQPAPILVSVAQAVQLIGIGRTHLYALMRSGEIPYVKIGTRRLLSPEALREWAARL